MYAGGIFIAIAAIFFFLSGYSNNGRALPWGWFFLTIGLCVYGYGPAPYVYGVGICGAIAIVLFFLSGVGKEFLPNQISWAFFLLALGMCVYGYSLYSAGGHAVILR